MSKKLITKNGKSKAFPGKNNSFRTLGPLTELEKHLPENWWKTLFNSLYLKTDGDVVENQKNTEKDVDLIINTTGITPQSNVLDLCCGQGRHAIELARRGFRNISGIDRSRYLVRLAKKRSASIGLKIDFSEGDARKIRLNENSQDCVYLMGNSFGYFEQEEDDLEVLKSVKRVLSSKGKILLDIVDGEWMKNNFEKRSWEWIDQSLFVCRERTLASDDKRIVSREVIVNAEIGVIADQFYAERLYSLESISDLLLRAGFTDVKSHGNIISDSTRSQDLGMMANRLIVSAEAPEKKVCTLKSSKILDVKVILGDPKLPDTVKRNNIFNEEDFETINLLKNNLKSLKKYRFSYLNDHKKLLKTLTTEPPAFVFNLCDEGYDNVANKELHIPAMLEVLNIPYTGAGPDCLALCYNKSIVRSIAANIDIPVPLETYYTSHDQIITLPHIFPAILKPNCGDGSVGITMNAVVNNAEELMSYLNELKETLPDTSVLVQEFLTGREFSVGIIGNTGKYEILPILEVDYSALPPHLPKILSYESKFIPESPYWNDIKYIEAVLSDDMQREITNYSMLLFERLGCRDYARIDFRMDADNNIKLLEVNPNPGWCWDGKLSLMAGFRGLNYGNLLEMILNVAVERLNLGD